MIMTEKEYRARIKSLESTKDVIDAEIDKLGREFLNTLTARLDLHEGDIVEVQHDKSTFNMPNENIWTKGYIKHLRIDWGGEVSFKLGALKKDGTPSGIGTVLYSVELTGKFKNKVRKIGPAQAHPQP